MPQVDYLKTVAALKAKLKKSSRVVGIVGYTQSYALVVHENLASHHDVGQAKYLEEPMRTNAKAYAKDMIDVMNSGGTEEQAVMKACLHLQRDSQLLVPVDTGALRASAFSQIEMGKGGVQPFMMAGG